MEQCQAWTPDQRRPRESGPFTSLTLHMPLLLMKPEQHPPPTFLLSLLVQGTREGRLKDETLPLQLTPQMEGT